MPERAPIPIAIVMRAFEAGGTERQMTELIRRLDPDRWKVHVACFRSEGAWLHKVLESRATLTTFAVRSLHAPATIGHVRAFADWCRRHQIRVVQSTELPSNLFALPAAMLAGVPVRIGARREINPNKSPLEIACQRAAYGCATTIVANSKAAAARLRRERVPERKIAVIPNGLDISAFRTAASLGGRTVVVVANLRPEKRHDVLIDAAPAVLRRFPDARFHIVGDGPERERLEARAAANGVATSFVFMGHQPDVAACLAGADIFVLPSESEGFPNAVLEAMACGLPVVASNLAAIREIVDHERSGLLVPPLDAPALADALCHLMRDRAGARRLGDAGRSAVTASYSFDRMVASFETLYLSALERRARRGAFRHLAGGVTDVELGDVR